VFCVYEQTYDIKGWTILPSSDGIRFTNDGTATACSSGAMGPFSSSAASAW
jgi:hypothetical protein